jgi:valyl-tRNA synthetase
MSKPTIDGEDVVAKQVSQQVLYTCLDYGLKLLHPFMPFVTEELWQRLRRRLGDDCPSIMVSAFPEPISAWDNDSAQEEFEVVNSIIKGCRSLVTNYNVKNANLFIQTPNSNLIKTQAHIMKSLVRNCESFNVLEITAEAPKGCTVYAIDDHKIFLMIKGHVDIAEEISKLEKKVSKATTQLNAIITKQKAEGYSKVTDEVRQLDDGKMKALESELAALSLTIKGFKEMLE